MKTHLLACTLTLALGFSLGSCVQTQTMPSETVEGHVLIATWPFGQKATDLALQTLDEGGSPLDAIEQGIRLIEHLGCDRTVGLAGRPNAAGYTQLDACIMSGPDHGAGSVAAMEGIKHPISAARLVMEKNPHVMIVGEGARWFALEHGLESVDVSDIPAKKSAWEKARLSGTPVPDPGERGHDTIGVLLRDAQGNLFGGCSSSGAGDKTPGRVGDSPILGSGLYVDNAVGAAAGTGLGENIMRYSASAMIVELMRQGLSPQAACEEMVHRTAATDPLGYDLSICFIAINKAGETGAACSNDSFPYAVTTPKDSQVLRVGAVTAR
ncbi:MAG: N(4)-(beta-N-acetylglucosaminyl)-L-asparaginase [Planctomycetota bacterium]|nr:N(4)-(beta-N-acetylglucosaminyl)-L-asparaginase [Planctomycetota bacterium]